MFSLQLATWLHDATVADARALSLDEELFGRPPAVDGGASKECTVAAYLQHAARCHVLCIAKKLAKKVYEASDLAESLLWIRVIAHTLHQFQTGP